MQIFYWEGVTAFWGTSSPQVLHWSVAEKHPRAINIIQSARNMHKRERGESEMQLMLRMHKKYVSNAGF